jgi:DNA replication and repair protein RecF
VTAESTIRSVSIQGLRSYASLDAAFGPGPQLIVGPNAAGKTTLLEAIVLLAWGRSHRTSADGELVRWGSDLARVEGVAGDETIEVALVRPAGAAGARKRIRVNGVPRRAAGLVGLLRAVVFAPEEMLLVVGSPSLRRSALDQEAGQLIGKGPLVDSPRERAEQPAHRLPVEIEQERGPVDPRVQVGHRPRRRDGHVDRSP